MKSLFSRFRSSDHGSSPGPSSKAPRRRPSDPSQRSTPPTTDKENRPLPAVPEGLILYPRSTPSPLVDSPLPSPTVSIRAIEPTALPPTLTSHHARIPGPSAAPGPAQQRNKGAVSTSYGEQHRDFSGEGKKVTFISPVSTPAASVLMDEIPAPVVPAQGYSEAELGSPISIRDDHRTVSSSSAGSSSARGLAPDRPAQSSGASRPGPSRSTSAQTSASQSQSQSQSKRSFFSLHRPSASRKASLPPQLPNIASTPQTVRPPSASPSPTVPTLSPTPSDYSLHAASYLPPANSWSEMAEDDLIANLGPKERTRQEVLWEIVSSEERYVQELVKLTETFCGPLLPTSALAPHLDIAPSAPSSFSPLLSPSPSLTAPVSPDLLPIASRFASKRLSSDSYPSLASTPTTPDFSSSSRLHQQSSSARQEAYNRLTYGRPKARPSLTSLVSASRVKTHQSMPPPSRMASADSTSRKGASRMSYHPDSLKGRSLLKKDRHSASSSLSVKEDLPEDLEKVLTVLANGVLEGHLKLVAALKQRYEDQYPLVRSLADIFNTHAYILKEYSTYVLHLEKALEQVEEAVSTVTRSTSRRSSRTIGETPQGRLGRHLVELEETAADRGEASLVIALSMPFQRLLKYPLLFQNLLYNTDPSLREYEATLAMVDQVEEIVRSIEDQKISQEERERTRDVWARIVGLERDKGLIVPRAGRMLVSERALHAGGDIDDPTPKDQFATVRQKSSTRRLSDFLKGSQDKPDMWVVEFTDVSLLCERTGMTHLPMSAGPGPQGRKRDSKSAQRRSMGPRPDSVRARNLYRFVKVQEWHLSGVNGEGALVSMEEIRRSRRSLAGGDDVGQVEEQTPAGLNDAEDRNGRQEELGGMDAATPRKPRPPTVGRSSTNPIKVALKTDDGGPSPARTGTRSGTVRSKTDTVVSDSAETVMSFAFRSGDQLLPEVSKATTIRSSLAARPPGSRLSGPVGRSASSNSPIKPSHSHPHDGVNQQRRSASGHVYTSAGQAKFAHRLRSTDSPDSASAGAEESGLDDDGDSTVRLRPVSMKARRSLPPAMRNTPLHANPNVHTHAHAPGAAGAERAGATPSALSGRKTPASTSGRATSNGANRDGPAWNAGPGKMGVSPASRGARSVGSAAAGRGQARIASGEARPSGRSLGGRI